MVDLPTTSMVQVFFRQAGLSAVHRELGSGGFKNQNLLQPRNFLNHHQLSIFYSPFLPLAKTASKLAVRINR